jgi:hypothetical protein
MVEYTPWGECHLVKLDAEAFESRELYEFEKVTAYPPIYTMEL